MSNGDHIVKLGLDEGVDAEIEKNTMPSHLGSFILSNSKRIINNFIRVFDGFQTYYIYIYNQDFDSLYMVKKQWNILNEHEMVGEDICQGKMIMLVVEYFLDFFYSSY